MIERDFDADWWNTICNHPDVRPWLGGEGPLDLSPLVLNPANFALRAENGGFIFVNHGQGAYCVHSQFLPEGRSGTTAAMQEARDFMFTRTDCVRIWTHLPDDNQPAANLAAKAGFRPWFRVEPTEIVPVATTMAKLEIDDWAATEGYPVACRRMAERGNAVKAVMLYNGWAQAAGVPLADFNADFGDSRGALEGIECQ